MISHENLLLTKLEHLLSWAKQYSIAYLALDLACCGVEMAQASGSRFDMQRFGTVEKLSPEHADLLIVAGTISYKMAATIRELYHAMPYPKYVLSLGSCSNCGGMFSWEYSYSTVSGLDKIIPVDVFVPGCPPRPEAILHGILALQNKIRSQKKSEQTVVA